MAEREELLTGWGRTAPTAAHVCRPHTAEEVAAAVVAAGPRGILARGLGRSYGDAAQNAGGSVLDLARLDTISSVDPVTAEVTCGAGVSIDALLHRTVPFGWFVPVTPGTRQVTLGGAVAADVHGKNHHRDGSLGAHVTRLELVDGSGERRTLTPADPLFQATVGGLGLTGVITSVTVRMIAVGSAWLGVDTTRTASLEDTMSTLAECDGRSRYSVAWIDCLARGGALGRGVVTAGDHLGAGDVAGGGDNPLAFAPRARAVAPRHVPAGVLGPRRMALFNAAYHRAAPRHAVAVPTHAAAFFHPLDVLDRWNRLYGPGGFLQYQFASPDPRVVRRVLEGFRSARVPGLLAVLKRFGPAGAAPLSFPLAGWTLAVDVPARTPGLATALDAADRLVLDSGGRVYLAKDARTAPEMVEAMYPRLPEWREVRSAADPRGVFTSDLARRLRL
ncbi:MAG TPA: FAD-binding oxidoreductase [Jatrophihabitans sp.]|jgi:decaprenylphospho-beta-D-ribofuranose 2-oxidase